MAKLTFSRRLALLVVEPHSSRACCFSTVSTRLAELTCTKSSGSWLRPSDCWMARAICRQMSMA